MLREARDHSVFPVFFLSLFESWVFIRLHHGSRAGRGPQTEPLFSWILHRLFSNIFILSSVLEMTAGRAAGTSPLWGWRDTKPLFRSLFCTKPSVPESSEIPARPPFPKLPFLEGRRTKTERSHRESPLLFPGDRASVWGDEEVLWSWGCGQLPVMPPKHLLKLYVTYILPQLRKLQCCPLRSFLISRYK